MPLDNVESAPEDAKVKGLMGVVTYVVDKPQALAIIFALVLLGMFLGVVPSTLTTQLENVDKKLDNIIVQHETMKEMTSARYDALQDQLHNQIDMQTAQSEKMIQVMRGMCLIIARQSNDSAALSYCNP